jgi:hypothetical protein
MPSPAWGIFGAKVKEGADLRSSTRAIPTRLAPNAVACFNMAADACCSIIMMFSFDPPKQRV